MMTKYSTEKMKMESRYGELFEDIEVLYEKDVLWISNILDGFIELDKRLNDNKASYGYDDVKEETFVAFQGFSELRRKYLNMRIGELRHEKEQLDDKILENDTKSLFLRESNKELSEQDRKTSRILKGRIELLELRVNTF